MDKNNTMNNQHAHWCKCNHDGGAERECNCKEKTGQQYKNILAVSLAEIPQIPAGEVMTEATKEPYAALISADEHGNITRKELTYEEVNKSPAELAKEYLVRNEAWNEDYWVCASNIANNIIKEDDHGANTYDASKHGRRAIMALCEVYAANLKPPTRSKP